MYIHALAHTHTHTRTHTHTHIRSKTHAHMLVYTKPCIHPHSACSSTIYPVDTNPLMSHQPEMTNYRESEVE